MMVVLLGKCFSILDGAVLLGTRVICNAFGRIDLTVHHSTVTNNLTANDRPEAPLFETSNNMLRYYSLIFNS